MKWLWITALLFLVTGVKSGPTGKDGDIVEQTIERIDRIFKGSAETPSLDEFMFTLSPLPNNDKIKLFLEVSVEGETESPIEAQDASHVQTPTFAADFTNYFGKNANFFITVKNESYDDIASAIADLTPFPKFPTVVGSTNLDDPRNPLKGTIIRLVGSLGSMLINNVDLLVTGEQLSYFSFLNTKATDYIPCNNKGGVPVCDVKLDHTITDTKHDPTVSSAVLAYGPKPNATIKLSFLNAEEIQDAILIPQLSNSFERNVLCTLNQFDGAKCTIDWSDPSYTGLQLIIIQKTTGTAPDLDTWETYSFDIHDRELVATQLGADIIEGRWLMLDGEYSADQTGKSVYRLRKSAFGENLPQDIDVDCSHLSLDPKLCFGYFPHLVKDKTYTLTVAYKESDKANEMDQIESSPVKIKASEPELEILSRHTTTHRNQQKADVQICFQHLTPTEGRSFSHYEMLIINEKGQWLKHRIMQEEEEEEEEEGDASEERLCFAPFTISTKDFDLTEGTKVVVSQRAVDGVSVLASGESALF
ncbi:uncharacterized protein [Macrobrachium rosenbergii]|uniref:uncharacterized protein n=1 Tax=Macrobrachium rosenbergii TaxID=79674 RepID=UPI0034D4A5F8